MKLRLSDACAILGLTSDPEPTLAQVNEAWRAKRSEHHPDRPEGDATRFDQARKAYELLHEHVTRPRPCHECNGHGEVLEQRGFVMRYRTCSRCRGEGTIRYQPNGERA